jgi:putative multiple sugar transport system substrate-binding protein
MKKIIALLLAALMIFALVACNGETTADTEKPADTKAASADTPAPADEPADEPAAETEPADEPAPADEGPALVGVSMPTKDLQRWNQDGANMKEKLEAAGYEVDLQYGANDINTQVSQIENMIANGAKVIVIAAIDGDSLGTVLAQAKENNIPIIAYDRLIMNSDAVSYYATFDNYLVGVMQGQYIVDALGLDSNDGPFNIEYITGDPGDNNINFFFDGAMSVLQPYVDEGKLVCQSGQTEKMDVATPGWATDKAQERFENILSTYYADKPLHAVMASNDSTAQGVANALASSYSNDVYPIITGQDCDIVSTQNMMDDKQAMSVFKDTRDLADKAVEMVDALVKGAEPPINDTETYDNGTGIIPSYLCSPKVCTKDTIQEILIDSGYYTEEDLAH